MKTKSLIAFLCLATLFPLPSYGEPKSYPGHRGYGMTKPCPWNCKMAGIPANKCREWRTGSMCHTEDFTRAPRDLSKSEPPVQNRVDSDGILGKGELPNPLIDYKHRPSAVVPSTPWQRPTHTHESSGSGNEECRRMDRYDVGQPHVDIGRTKSTGGFFDDKYKVRGTVEGVCLVEAGLFQHGRKVAEIPVTTSRDFRRFEFEVKASVSDDPEIRVYNINGERDVYHFTGPE